LSELADALNEMTKKIESGLSEIEGNVRDIKTEAASLAETIDRNGPASECINKIMHKAQNLEQTVSLFRISEDGGNQ